MDEFLNYERYGADGVLIDLLFVLDPAEKALFFFFLVKLLETGEFKYNLEDLVEW